ncbi:MAG: hypothetical protein PHQ40_04795 [Anaerolineaceae bacterium]|nr:hypothetical protein [Anaerolineaceae bacterium]
MTSSHFGRKGTHHAEGQVFRPDLPAFIGLAGAAPKILAAPDIE